MLRTITYNMGSEIPIITVCAAIKVLRNYAKVSFYLFCVCLLEFT